RAQAARRQRVGEAVCRRPVDVEEGELYATRVEAPAVLEQGVARDREELRAQLGLTCAVRRADALHVRGVAEVAEREVADVDSSSHRFLRKRRAALGGPQVAHREVPR